MIKTLPVFLPASTVKKWLREEILQWRASPTAIYAAFRSGNPHAVSLHVLPNKFRIIDNNVGILKEKSKSLRFT